jgi:hypothetical protein
VDKLSIGNEMAQFDKKNRRFYKELTDEEKKKFSNYLMVRWGSTVHGSQDLQEFYVIACNERLNKHFFAINKHPELQWLCATTVSPGLGTQKHQWIKPKSKQAGTNNFKKQLMELYPNMKADEIELMSAITNKKELEEHLQALGREK